MLKIGDKDLRKRSNGDVNINTIHLGTTNIWPYIIRVEKGAWVINVDNRTLPATGGTVTITSITRNIVNTWVNFIGNTNTLYTTTTSETLQSYTLTSNIGTVNGNKVTVPYNPNTTDRNITLTITASDGTTATVTVTQTRNVITYSNWSLSLTANPTSLPADGGTSTLTASCERTYTNTNGQPGGTETSPVTLSINIGSISNNVLTVPANSNSSPRTITVTASAQGLSTTATITQEAAVEATPTISIYNGAYDRWSGTIGYEFYVAVPQLVHYSSRRPITYNVGDRQTRTFDNSTGYLPFVCYGADGNLVSDPDNGILTNSVTVVELREVTTGYVLGTFNFTPNATETWTINSEPQIVHRNRTNSPIHYYCGIDKNSYPFTMPSIPTIPAGGMDSYANKANQSMIVYDSQGNNYPGTITSGTTIYVLDWDVVSSNNRSVLNAYVWRPYAWILVEYTGEKVSIVETLSIANNLPGYIHVAGDLLQPVQLGPGYNTGGLTADAANNNTIDIAVPKSSVISSGTGMLANPAFIAVGIIGVNISYTLTCQDGTWSTSEDGDEVHLNVRSENFSNAIFTIINGNYSITINIVGIASAVEEIGEDIEETGEELDG